MGPDGAEMGGGVRRRRGRMQKRVRGMQRCSREVKVVKRVPRGAKKKKKKKKNTIRKSGKEETRYCL